MNRKLRVDIWSDIACPWCYIGKRRLEAALDRFAHADEVEVIWRAFELDPTAPKERDPAASHAARLAKKYGLPVARAEAMIQQNAQIAKGDGLEFQPEKIREGNTFDAHRVVHLGAERGIQDAVKERLMRAYMCEGQLLSDHETLVRLGAEAGLDANEVRETLASDRFATAVRGDEREARALGISGVPFFVLDGRYGVSGAQPADLLLSALTQAWEELGQTADETAEGDETESAAVCGPDGCAVPGRTPD
ncbi:MAG TPA: DsbA family oxidoreductase [Polyangia bacterium]